MMRQSRTSGFTLLEILVAVAIMIVILLIVSQVFQHTSSAWEAGRRKTSLNMDGRAILGFMAEELSRAVALPNSTNHFENNKRIMFRTVKQGPYGERSMYAVDYDATGAGVLKRWCGVLDLGKQYPGLTQASIDKGHVELMDKCDVEFKFPAGAPFGTVLPLWIDIYLTLDSGGGQFHTFKAWSEGPPDGEPIRSWESKM